MRTLISFRTVGEVQPLPTVFKIEIGKKYFIWKAPDLHASHKFLAIELDKKVRYFDSLKETDLFFKIAKYIKQHRVYALISIPLFATEDLQKLVDFEAAELEKSQSDPNCLNSDFNPYLPKWVKEGLNISATASKSIDLSSISEKDKKSPKSNKSNEKHKEKTYNADVVWNEDNKVVVVPKDNGPISVSEYPDKEDDFSEFDISKISSAINSIQKDKK